MWGKVVVVIGVLLGIGKVMAIKLVEVGVKVIMVVCKFIKLEKVRKEIELKGGEVYVYSVDIVNLEDCDWFVN